MLRTSDVCLITQQIDNKRDWSETTTNDTIQIVCIWVSASMYLPNAKKLFVSSQNKKKSLHIKRGALSRILYSQSEQ